MCLCFEPMLLDFKYQGLVKHRRYLISYITWDKP